ncbi:phage head-tail adapter protein [Staphylococcus gallinarum]|uniref:phage head-tail adapter protein n=1 Tax=Staphylococcus gallinarum TaxID=1293 RepID=UPI000D1C8C6D|nr:phage head-tail adapter protein [Staphylococcus gallinarum]MCD8872335.1 phage head-tail adapter protein [Staphylococcus gallinarum]MCD8910210.1 phage head-tail adapter protein [Staphylococcus gallinarum]MCW0984569.1 phage head-tail adapter protein [Staphylococcus gallinarum]PTE77767.1 phage head-tail adapter protein [Staphylococcus gallinarum]RIO83292.1 phage head-tail adapter protein [Staphylococcus gallinarum]
MFNPFTEFPHEIDMGVLKLVGQYPNEKERYESEKIINGFMDTPTSSERLQFHQMSNDFDRNLYTPYDLPINPNKTIFKYEGKLYECNGDSVDQGGQHEINLTKLKEVPNGQSKIW